MISPLRLLANLSRPRLFDWSLSVYGQKYTNEFVANITRNIEVELDQMSTDWMGPRLPVPDFDTEKWDAECCRSHNHYISKFYYPRYGGFFFYFELDRA